MRSANRGNGNNVTYVNANGNCNNNNANNGNRSAADCAGIGHGGVHEVIVVRKHHGTRSLLPECESLEQYGGDGHALRDVGPISAISPEDVIGFDALWDCMELCKSGVLWKGSVSSFYMNAPERIARMSDELRNGTYRHGRTTTFTVTHPKRREIVAQTFRDRVYHRSIVENLLVPVVFPRLIYDNAACQKGKGTDFARERLRRFLREQHRRHGPGGHVLMMDVRKYYDSMRHDVVEGMFEDMLPGWGASMVIDALRAHYPGDVGYSPGSSIVQVAGISVLNGIDHRIKERMGIRGYSRYMDDLRLIHQDRAHLERCRDEISGMLAEIGFETHPTKTVIVPMSETIPYLGFDFSVTETGKVLMLVNASSPKQMRRKVGRLAKLEMSGERPDGTTRQVYEGWRAHAKKGDSRSLIRRCDQWYEDLWRDNRC